MKTTLITQYKDDFQKKLEEKIQTSSFSEEKKEQKKAPKKILYYCDLTGVPYYQA